MPLSCAALTAAAVTDEPCWLKHVMTQQVEMGGEKRGKKEGGRERGREKEGEIERKKEGAKERQKEREKEIWCISTRYGLDPLQTPSCPR